MDDNEWVAEGQQTGCTVLSEGDPLPSAHFGHMSFSSFNPELQKLQVSNTVIFTVSVPPHIEAHCLVVIYKKVSSNNSHHDFPCCIVLHVQWCGSPLKTAQPLPSRKDMHAACVAMALPGCHKTAHAGRHCWVLDYAV